ncbi:galactokinase [Evansella tamaricis]|uniref:Galactokinase n=1 Tax=Evansella tamaricis TaxID=2069301 RepID=A0ABS6JGP4_9BACI|nr:galactokinase [Evansella tamaricis]MBU9712840.1 galactokinase [Evansella tamaricis]
MLNRLKQIFYNTFYTTDDLHYFFAPGRVNLIGEHTDYNGGLVFPCALNIGTYAAVRKREDNKILLYSDNFSDKGVMEFSLSDLNKNNEHDWANYPKGVIYIMEKHGLVGSYGFEAVFFGNIPNGAGLSSSASIELVTALLWDELNEFGVDRLELVKMCQEAENEYIGVNCGIMDQFSIGLGKKDHAILLDCDTLDFEYAPVRLGECQLVIANTNKRRGLADSKYNERRLECEEAVRELQTAVDISNLCELSLREFEGIKQHISRPIVMKRARHAITENERTKQAAIKLKEGDLIGMGQLMNESHQSLKDDYEVTGEHLDALVEAAWEEEDVLGARMTGAGFGGCTINLIKNRNIEEVLSRIAKKYEARTGLNPEFYTVEVGHGTMKLSDFGTEDKS